jgi:hypothetical protein
MCVGGDTTPAPGVAGQHNCTSVALWQRARRLLGQAVQCNRKMQLPRNGVMHMVTPLPAGLTDPHERECIMWRSQRGSAYAHVQQYFDDGAGDVPDNVASFITRVEDLSSDGNSECVLGHQTHATACARVLAGRCDCAAHANRPW